MTPGDHALGLTLMVSAIGLATRFLANVLPRGAIDVATLVGLVLYVFIVLSIGYGLAILFSGRKTH